MQNDPKENNQPGNSDTSSSSATEEPAVETDNALQEEDFGKARIISKAEPLETDQKSPDNPSETADSNNKKAAVDQTANSTPQTTEPDQPIAQDGKQTNEEPDQTDLSNEADNFYYIRFRTGDPSFSSASRISGLNKGEIVMVQSDHGLEPAIITSKGPATSVMPEKEGERASYLLTRRANRDEISKFERLKEREKEAFDLCQKYIEKHQLEMKLTRVERFFNGSKIIFYFTAENRVDFRELVKDLVQEFRTRVEIRQIGVRHETKMIGGLGCCGRELCCSSFIKNFSPVSIKMAKAQNLPLNPAKISGVCNRLLCCLTYEYETYRKLRKGMPKVGKNITIDGTEYKVINNNILAESITVIPPDQPDQAKTLTREEWSAFKPKQQEQQQKPGINKGQHQQSKKKGRSGKGHKQKHRNKNHSHNKDQSKE